MATKEIRGMEIDAKEFRFLAKALKKADKALYLELKRNLKAAGDLVAKDAKAISSRYSTSIPPTIKTRVRGLTVYVEAGGNRGGVGDRTAAKEIQSMGYGGSSGAESRIRRAEEGVVIAGLFEAGNKGGKSESQINRGTFRHPVFGGPAWTNQEMHPYLIPAYKKNEAAVLGLVVEALNEVAKIIVTED